MINERVNKFKYQITLLNNQESFIPRFAIIVKKIIIKKEIKEILQKPYIIGIEYKNLGI